MFCDCQFVVDMKRQANVVFVFWVKADYHFCPQPKCRTSFALLDEIGQVTLAAIVAIDVHGHENTWTAKLVRAIAAEAGDFVAGVNLVELKNCQLDLFTLVLDLLGFRVRLLLRFSTSTASVIHSVIFESAPYLFCRALSRCG